MVIFGAAPNMTGSCVPQMIPATLQFSSGRKAFLSQLTPTKTLTPSLTPLIPQPPTSLFAFKETSAAQTSVTGSESLALTNFHRLPPDRLSRRDPFPHRAWLLSFKSPRLQKMLHNERSQRFYLLPHSCLLSNKCAA